MEAYGENLSAASIIKAFARNRRAIYLLVAVGISISLALALLLPKKFTATATILPSGRGAALGQLSNIIASQSSALTAKIPENSSLLYPTVLSSRYLLTKLVTSDIALDSGKAELKDILGAKSREDALKKIRKILDVSMDKKTQVIMIKATTGNPKLSAAIVNKSIELLEEFNREKSARRAEHNFAYLNEKLKETKKELNEAEEKLIDFEKKHMDYATSTDPDVLMLHAELKRELELKETSYIELLKEIELARIALKRQEPIVKILDSASPPTLKSAPKRKPIAVLGGLITLLVSFAYCVLREFPITILLDRFT